MTKRKDSVAVLVAALALAWVSAAGAQLSPAQKCEKAKNKAAGKRALCIAKERGKEIAGHPFNYAACSTTMAVKFATAQQNAINQGGSCPTSGDAAAIEARIDGIFNPSKGIPMALAAVRFVDNGDGTVSDTQTGLQWEKKDNLGGGPNFPNAHDADNSYSWSATSPAYEVPSGSAYTDFLYKLNNCTYDGSTYAGGFAGHCDWRLPTEAELLSIVDATQGFCGGGSGACIPAVFGPTQASYYYWSSTTNASTPNDAWYVFFNDGSANPGSKAGGGVVRGVRGGS